MADLDGKKILVVDDNKMIRRQLSAMLSKHGAQIFQASNGQDGFDVALAKIPDVILMDVQMPEMDGYEATTKIKSEETTKEGC